MILKTTNANAKSKCSNTFAIVFPSN